MASFLCAIVLTMATNFPTVDYCESCGEPSAIVGIANFDDGTSGKVCKDCQEFFNLSLEERNALRYHYLVG